MEYTHKHVFYIYTFFHPFLKIFTFFNFQDMIFVLYIVVEEKKNAHVHMTNML